MPLSFMYGKSITKKEGFSLKALPSHLLELQKKLDSWTTEYSIDLEQTFKKFKELELIQPFFPGEMPIFFASGEYRAEQLETHTPFVSDLHGLLPKWMFHNTSNYL